MPFFGKSSLKSTALSSLVCVPPREEISGKERGPNGGC